MEIKIGAIVVGICQPLDHQRRLFGMTDTAVVGQYVGGSPFRSRIATGWMPSDYTIVDTKTVRLATPDEVSAFWTNVGPQPALSAGIHASLERGEKIGEWMVIGHAAEEI